MTTMFDQIIRLIDVKRSTDAYGDEEVTKSERIVFAEMKSIGQAEFYQAAAVGLKPEIKFVLPDYLEYQGETMLKYTPDNGAEQEYFVVRTFRTGTELELVCKRGVD